MGKYCVSVYLHSNIDSITYLNSYRRRFRKYTGKPTVVLLSPFHRPMSTKRNICIWLYC